MLDEFTEGKSFTERVKRCESYAAKHPEAYRRRVIAMAWVGYWMVPVIMAFFLGIGLVVIWHVYQGDRPLSGKIFLDICWAIYMFGVVKMVRVFFIPARPSEGQEVTQAQAPKLFSMIEDVRRQLDAPEIDKVIVNDDLNAAAVFVPKRNRRQQARNELILGMPLLEALTHDELKSVIAHEFGHFSGEHGRDGFAVFRTIRAWDIALSTIADTAGWTGAPPYLLAKFYLPRFLAYSFALRRDNEYFADRAAVAATSKAAASDALKRLHLAHAQLDRLKADAIVNAARAAAPPDHLFGKICKGLADANRAHDARVTHGLALIEQPDPTDTHPALHQRLAAIGADQDLPGDVAEPAAALLDTARQDLTRHFDEQFAREQSDSWSLVCREVRTQVETFADLDAQAAAGSLPFTDALERAHLSRLIHGHPKRTRFFSEAVCGHPDNPEAHFLMGWHLAETGDERALEFLETAASLDETATGSAFQLAANVAAANMRLDQAKAYLARAEEWFNAHEAMLHERGELRPQAVLKVCMSDTERSDLCEILALDPFGFNSAHLVDVATPVWLSRAQWLIVEPKAINKMYSDEALSDSIYEIALEQGISPQFSIKVLKKDDAWLRDKLAALAGAQVWPQAQSADSDPQDAAKQAA